MCRCIINQRTNLLQEFGDVVDPVVDDQDGIVAGVAGLQLLAGEQLHLVCHVERVSRPHCAGATAGLPTTGLIIFSRPISPQSHTQITRRKQRLYVKVKNSGNRKAKKKYLYMSTLVIYNDPEPEIMIYLFSFISQNPNSTNVDLT